MAVLAPPWPGDLSEPAEKLQWPKQPPLTCAGSVHAAAITGPCGESQARRGGDRGALSRPPPLPRPRGDLGWLSPSPLTERLAARSKGRKCILIFLLIVEEPHWKRPQNSDALPTAGVDRTVAREWRLHQAAGNPASSAGHRKYPCPEPSLAQRPLHTRHAQPSG